MGSFYFKEKKILDKTPDYDFFFYLFKNIRVEN